MRFVHVERDMRSRTRSSSPISLKARDFAAVISLNAVWGLPSRQKAEMPTYQARWIGQRKCVFVPDSTHPFGAKSKSGLAHILVVQVVLPDDVETRL